MPPEIILSFFQILQLFSILLSSTGKTTAAVSAAKKVEKYIIALDTNGGTFIDYDENRDIYFQPREPLKLPKAQKKGYVFCGWTTKITSNVAWFTITGENTDNRRGSTYHWHESKKLFAQYAKVTMKKLGKRKLKVSLSKWVDAGQLEIQYSTNKTFKDAKSIVAEYSHGSLVAPIDEKNCSLKFNRKKKTLSLTLNKLKPKKRYYFRFQYNRTESGVVQEDVLSISDWFQKSVKM